MNKLDINNINDFLNLSINYRLTDGDIETLESKLRATNSTKFLYGVASSVPSKAVASVEIYNGQFLYFIESSSNVSE